MALAEACDRNLSPVHEAGASSPYGKLSRFPPASQEGFFDPDAPSSYNPVVSYDVSKPVKISQGIAKMGLVGLENGRKYEIVDAIINEPRSDKHLILGTALATSIRGHNWNIWLKMVELGFSRVTLIGPEGGHADWPHTPAQAARLLRNLASISVQESAVNAHEIIRYQHSQKGQTEKELVQIGESRFAGIGIGFNALASEYGHEIIYSDQMAPPFPKPKPLKPNLKLVGRAGEIGTQVFSLGWNARKMNPRKAWHYSRTVNPNLFFMAHVAATVPSLVSGQIGRLAQAMPGNTRMHVTHFEGDPWTNIEAWQDALSDFPNVTEDIREGDHGAIVHPENQLNRYKRIENLRDELERAGQDPNKVNWRAVYMGGQLAVAA